MSGSPKRVIFSTDPDSPQNDSHVFGLIESPYSRLDGSISENSPLIAPFNNDQDTDDQEEEEMRVSKWDSWKKLFHTRIRYYIPVLAWAPKYAFDQVFKQDFIAGISVAFLIIPQVLCSIYILGIIICSSSGKNSSNSRTIHGFYTIDFIYFTRYF
jgi:hypothetical protein